MVNENIASKLTPAAKEALEVLAEEYKNTVIESAYSIAEERHTGNKEISLKDILDAKRPISNLKSTVGKGYAKRKWQMLISFSGAVYAVLGLLLYLLQNRKFNIETDLGLIIAIFGIVISLLAYLYMQYSQLTSSTISRNYRIVSMSSNNAEDEIVKSWRNIEDLAKKSMSKTDKDEYKSNSVGFLIRYLSHKIANNENEFLKIKKLLQIRNKIVHEGYTMDISEKKELIDFSSELIRRLETAQFENKEATQNLIVIKATYETSQKSLDATQILNQLINNNRLEVVVNNDLVGDPDFGTVKQLRITYKIGNLEKTEVYPEGEKLILPN